ncbi:hypothetical protein [Escherichia coli]|uniref:hypothetical protein n=1 Tax=Escherichia coli TaxID=562 RepID=UPI002026A06C|nr:hypothetical protein [Escherichia coli]
MIQNIIAINIRSLCWLALAAWGNSWGARFVAEQVVPFYGSEKTICSSVMVPF